MLIHKKVTSTDINMADHGTCDNSIITTVTVIVLLCIGSVQHASAQVYVHETLVNATIGYINASLEFQSPSNVSHEGALYIGDSIFVNVNMTIAANITELILFMDYSTVLKIKSTFSVGSSLSTTESTPLESAVNMNLTRQTIKLGNVTLLSGTASDLINLHVELKLENPMNTIVAVGPIVEFSFHVQDVAFGDIVGYSTRAHVLGADLYLTDAVYKSGNVEAGNNLYYQLDIRLPTWINTSADNVLVMLGFQDSDVSLNSADYQLPGTASNVSASLPDMHNGIACGSINNSDTLSFYIHVTVKDSVNLNSHIGLDVIIKYYDQNGNGTLVSKHGSILLSTKGIGYSNITSDLSNILGAGQPVTLSAVVSIPKGTVAGLGWRIALLSSNLTSLAVEVPYMKASSSDGVTIPYPDGTLAKRRKRATNLVVVTSFGDITNSASSGNPTVTLNLTVAFLVPPSAITSSGALDVSVALIASGSSVAVNSMSTTILAPPLLVLTKTIAIHDTNTSPDKVQVTVIASHGASSNYAAYDVILTDTISPGMIGFLSDNFQPSPSTPGFSHYDSKSFRWLINSLIVGETATLSYIAQPSGDNGIDLQTGTTYYKATMKYRSYDPTNVTLPAVGVLIGPVETEVCVERIDKQYNSIWYQHGWTFLAAICGMVVGLLVVFFIVFLCVKCCRLLFCGSVYPIRDAEKATLGERGTKIMLDAKKAIKKGGNTIKEYSTIAIDESIVFILSLKDKLQIHREIDSLDILSTIHVDTDLEQERREAMVQGITLLIHSLHTNGDINKETEDRVLNNFKSGLNALESTIDVDMKVGQEMIFRKILARNKEQLTDLLNKQKDEKVKLFDETRSVSEEDRTSLFAVLDQQHQTEQNELTYKLKLHQDKETEQLRKEFAIKKRMGLKELQQKLLDDVKVQGKLVEQQADWLMSEHLRIQGSVERMYDDEVSRQRMLLEEKLAQRRAFVTASEAQEDDQNAILNTMAGHQMDSVQRIKKQGIISPEQAAAYIEKIKADMFAVKDQLDKEHDRQEAILHKRLSKLKQQRMAEKAQQHSSELATFEKRSKEQQTDPVSLIADYKNIVSKLRAEKDQFENQLDCEHAEELQKLRNEIFTSTKTTITEFEGKMMADLKENGVSGDQLEKIMSQHQREMTKLQKGQEQERQKQQLLLKERLVKIREDCIQQQNEEKEEQAQLRHHETVLVKKLLNNQMSMSEEERERILQQHEKDMVKLEHSLTLSKLQQKLLLEEKLTERRSRQMERLQNKHNKEATKLKRQLQNNGEDSEDEGHSQQVTLLKEYAEQRLAILQGQQLNLESEMEDVRVVMVRDRALTLREQEEKLGAMVTELQINKARELAKIEEQQTAIYSLKTNLVDDLTERGVLSHNDCQLVIMRHKEEQEKLQKRLDSQRVKQEKALRKRMQERMAQKESMLGQEYENDLHNMAAAMPNKTSMKIRRTLMMHKQMGVREELRHQMDRETSQTLQYLRRQFEISKLKSIQEQELQFIAGLVRLGHLRRSELTSVLKLLFPGKTETDLNVILSKICDAKELAHDKDDSISQEGSQLLSESSASRLEERIRSIALETANSRPTSRAGSIRSSVRSSAGQMRRSSAKTRSNLPLTDEEESIYLSPSRQGLIRPEPLGQDRSERFTEPLFAKDGSDDDHSPERSFNYSQLTEAGRGGSSSQLPPIEITGRRRKKKKSTLKKLVKKHVDEELDEEV